MKTIRLSIQILSVITIFLTLASCEKWDTIGIKGKGPIESENIELSEVRGISLEIPATVYLSQGNEQSIEIEAQQNILDNIEKNTTDKILRLKFDRNVGECKPITIYMTISNLKEINVSGSGEVYTNSKFYADDYLSIQLSGSGKIDLEADAKVIELNISGSGEIALSSICDELYGNISGSGNIDLENGQASSAEFSISGSGDIFAYQFPVEYCFIHTAGSGDSRVTVSEQLNVSIAGSGDVYYKGNPQLSVSIAGSGDVVNAN